MKYSIQQQLTTLAYQAPAPSAKRGAWTHALNFFTELASHKGGGYVLECNLIGANHWNSPLKLYRDFYVPLGLLKCKQNAQGEWLYKMNLEAAKKITKELIESGNPRTLHMLNEPQQPCYLLALDKIFPEYIPGSDAWMRVMSLLKEEDRKDVLDTLQFDAYANGRAEAEYEAQHKAVKTTKQSA